MKQCLLFFLISSITVTTYAQSVAIAADKMNVFYAGIDNPITIAAENTSSKSLIIKTTNGKMVYENGQYIFRSETIGKTEITVYKKVNHKLIKLGSSDFRVKTIPLPVFKIGTGRHSVIKAELASQEYVRAELENFGIDAKFSIDSFTVCIIPSDTCRYASIKNIGNKISDEIRSEFEQLKENDVVIFKKIFAKTPGDVQVELLPVMVMIY